MSKDNGAGKMMVIKPAEHLVLEDGTKIECGTCPYYYKGLCRMATPQVTAVLVPQAPTSRVQVQQAKGVAIGVKPFSFWPPMAKDQWCGRHPGFGLWFEQQHEKITEDPQIVRPTPLDGGLLGEQR